MKKPIYFYVLLVLSSISAIFSAYGVFFSKATAKFPETDNAQLAQYYKETEVFLSKMNSLNHGILSMVVVVLSLLLLAGTWYFLLKRDIPKASYLYLGDLILGFLFSLYSFVFTRGLIASVYTSDFSRSSASFGLVVGLATAIVFFLIFAGVIVFKLFRYQNVQEEAAEI